METKENKILCRKCRKAEVSRDMPYWPFCSERCKVGDLGAWASERYRVPGEAVPSEAEPESASVEPASPSAKPRT